MQPDPLQTRTATRAAVSYDAGLQAHMQRIYNRMTLGVLITAVTSWIVGSSPALLNLFLGGPQAYVVIFAPMAVLWFGFNPATMPSSRLKMSFILISVLYGISFAAIFAMARVPDIARAFFITTGMFAGLSIFGYTTKKNLDGLRSFAVMGIWGVFIMLLLHMFMPVSSGMMNLISGVAIVAFASLTAWQTQAMKEMYHSSHGDEGNSRMAWAAALTLYISFIALFQHILRFTSNNR
jgi:uncharacterized protein